MDNNDSVLGNGSSASDDVNGCASGNDVEWLVNTRTKRSTAGNRLHALLQEESDDELELLFAEDEDDTGFHDNEADLSDVQMDSSTDEEDQGPAAGDDLEGERELQKSIKDARTKKKKPQNGMPKILKKVRIDSTLSDSTPRPKKRSERVSWLPKSFDAPVRASSRETTQQSKQELHVQMMDREIKRLKQLANMEKIAAAKAAKEKPPLTQEDRLKEAARVEKANAKSLSRWERAEREREEEHKLKLANLHNRHLEGPVLTLWSGMATYVGGKLQKVGKMDMEVIEKPATKKRKIAVIEEGEKAYSNEPESNSVNRPQISENDTPKSTDSLHISDKTTTTSRPESEISSHTTPEAISQASSLYSIQPSDQSTSSCLAPPAGLPLVAPPHPFLAPPSLDGSSPLPGLGYYPHQSNYCQYLPPHYQSHFHAKFKSSPLAPSITEHCLRSTIIFNNFSETTIKSRETQLNILFPYLYNASNRPSKISRTKGSSKGPACIITGHPAKYKDPNTGLYYYNLHAYKQIQKLLRNEVWWSDLLGLYVGCGTAVPARGVPDRFKGEVKVVS